MPNRLITGARFQKETERKKISTRKWHIKISMVFLYLHKILGILCRTLVLFNKLWVTGPEYAWLLVTVINVRPKTWMELRRAMKDKASLEVDQAFSTSRSPFLLFNVTRKMLLNTSQRITLNKTVNLSTIRVDCCREKYADLTHYLLNCPIVSTKYPDLRIVIKTPVNRWKVCHVKTMNDVMNYIDVFIKCKLTRQAIAKIWPLEGVTWGRSVLFDSRKGYPLG